MGSRIRENVKHYFECFCEVVGPQPDGNDAWIIQKFPETYKDEEVLKSVPKFAFPCDFDNSTVQHYSFVLTSHDSTWTFGFCRHDPKSETALVVLSYLPWHESFTKFLNVTAELTHSDQSDELWKFLDAVYQTKVPDPGGSFKIPIHQNGQNHFICQSPSQFLLPSIPENRNLTEYYNAVDSHNMMVVFASMLYERRIVFTSRRLNRLSACVQSANAILYPMHWQHIFIPVLPRQLVDYLLAPMPYLIGVSNTLLNNVRKNDLGEVVILDADNNTVQTPFQDLESLPQDVVKNLKAQLRNRAALLGDGVSRAFLRALVQLIGGYRDALRFHQGKKITFSEDAFVESRPPSMQPFLRKMLELQIFQQFIEERLDMLNAGLGFSDEFEMEACNYSDNSSFRLKQQYREWLYNMRKDTSAFFKSVKSRANPAVKSAVKTDVVCNSYIFRHPISLRMPHTVAKYIGVTSNILQGQRPHNKVKERGKHVGKAYKGIRSRFRDSPPPDSSTPTVASRPRPHTTFITSATTSYRRDLSLKQRLSTGPDSCNQYSPFSPSSPESGLDLTALDMDLMGDLQDVIFRHCSSPGSSSTAESPTVDRALKPVRSLESFPAEGQAGASDPFTPVRLPPPTRPHPRQKEETNLIRLDSESSVDDFDPLLSKDRDQGTGAGSERRGLSLTNPLYPYFTPQHLPQDSHRRDLDLLKEYGLDFNSLSVQSTPAHHSLSITPSQQNWTKFD